jgi:hypothetical protein
MEHNLMNINHRNLCTRNEFEVLTAVDMKSFIFRDITPCKLLKLCLLPASCWLLLASLTVQPQKTGAEFFSEALVGIMSEKVELFNEYLTSICYGSLVFYLGETVEWGCTEIPFHNWLTITVNKPTDKLNCKKTFLFDKNSNQFVV